MKKAVVVARILMALPLIVFGLNGLLQFFEPPMDGVPDKAIACLSALNESGYVFQVKSVIEVLCGALILTGMFVPFALVLFAPILVNIVAYHLVLDTNVANGGAAWLLLACELFLAFAYWKSFGCLFEARAKSRYQT